MADYRNSLFKSKTGKSVVVAFDHGLAAENPIGTREQWLRNSSLPARRAY